MKIFSEPGFPAAVAKHLKISPQNITGWKRVPAHHVLDLEVLLGMTAEEIRPDVFARKKRDRDLDKRG